MDEEEEKWPTREELKALFAEWRKDREFAKIRDQFGESAVNDSVAPQPDPPAQPDPPQQRKGRRR